MNGGASGDDNSVAVAVSSSDDDESGVEREENRREADRRYRAGRLDAEDDAYLMAYARPMFSKSIGPLAVLMGMIKKYGTYPLSVYLQMIRDLVYFRKMGVAHTIKTIILGILTTLAALLGGLMEFIAPSFFQNIKTGVQSMLSFLSEEASHAATIIFLIFSGISVSFPILRKILDVSINTVLGVANPAMHFSDREINQWVAARFPEDQRVEMAHRLRGVVELFNGRYTQADGKYDAFQHSGDFRYILKAFQNLRVGKVSTCRKSIGAHIAKLEESIRSNSTPEKLAQMRALRHALDDLNALDPDIEAGRPRLEA